MHYSFIPHTLQHYPGICSKESDSIGMKIGEQNVVMVTYADRIIIMGESEDPVRNKTSKLKKEKIIRLNKNLPK